MNVEFKKNKLQKQLSDASEIKRAFGVNAKRISMRMADIIAAPSLLVLIQIPTTNCHQLTGDRKGQWAIDVSANHRLIFEISNDPIPQKEDGAIDVSLVTDICILEITDYH